MPLSAYGMMRRKALFLRGLHLEIQHMLIPKMFASYDETIDMAIAADVANRVHEEYKKITT
jgi:hypothetical protein